MRRKPSSAKKIKKTVRLNAEITGKENDKLIKYLSTIGLSKKGWVKEKIAELPEYELVVKKNNK